MKKAAILFALLIALSGCGSAQPTASSQTNVSNESSISQNASDLESSSDTSSDSDVSEAAASETAVSKAAASETAVSKAAASEAAASVAAASEAAASEAAVSEAAVSEAAASEAAASESAASSEAAVSSESAVKSASEVSVEETSNEPAPESATSKTTVKTVTGTNFLNSVEKLVLRKINREREAEGLSALTYDEDLRSAARLRSRELYKANKFEHKRPNGDEWNTVLDEDIPVDYIAAGENLCMTEYNDPNNNSGKSATFWVDQWMESPPHYENLMRSEYTHAGVGIYYIEKDGMVYAYATMIFAQL